MRWVSFQNNLLTTLAIVVEFFLNFVPHVNLYFRTYTTINVSVTWGAYSSVLSAIETAISACIYTKVLIRRGGENTRSSGQPPATTYVTQHRQSLHTLAVYQAPVHHIPRRNTHTGATEEEMVYCTGYHSPISY